MGLARQKMHGGRGEAEARGEHAPQGVFGLVLRLLLLRAHLRLGPHRKGLSALWIWVKLEKLVG